MGFSQEYDWKKYLKKKRHIYKKNGGSGVHEQMQTTRKKICSREGTSANYGEACKERFNSLRSASVDVVCSHPFAPQICFQIDIY